MAVLGALRRLDSGRPVGVDELERRLCGTEARRAGWAVPRDALRLFLQRLVSWRAVAVAP